MSVSRENHDGVVLYRFASLVRDEPRCFRHAIGEFDLDIGQILVGLHVEARIRNVRTARANCFHIPSGWGSEQGQSHAARRQLHLEAPVVVDRRWHFTVAERFSDLVYRCNDHA